jgi:hypothetical protein
MLETSEAEFASRYHAYAAEGLLYAQTEGSPLLEFTAGGRVLYLFDRCGPYAAPAGPARVIVHGVLRSHEVVAPGASARLSVVGVSALDGCGPVIARPDRRTAVVQARLPLVLSTFEPLTVAVGEWLRFVTEAPLHGFVMPTSRAPVPRYEIEAP